MSRSQEELILECMVLPKIFIDGGIYVMSCPNLGLSVEGASTDEAYQKLLSLLRIEIARLAEASKDNQTALLEILAFLINARKSKESGPDFQMSAHNYLKSLKKKATYKFKVNNIPFEKIKLKNLKLDSEMIRDVIRLADRRVREAEEVAERMASIFEIHEWNPEGC